MEQRPPKRRGCLFYGGIIAVVLLVAVLIAGLLAVRTVKRMLNEYTDTKPMSLPAVNLSKAEVDRVKKRITDFEQALSNNRPAEPLTLNSDEINAYIANDPSLQILQGKVYVMLDGDKAKAQVSVPLDQVGLSVFKGRYLNGVAVLDVILRNGFLQITPDEITVKGKPLPAVYMNKLHKENFAGDVNTNSGNSAALQKIQDIRIKDGKLVIVPKGPEKQ